MSHCYEAVLQVCGTCVFHRVKESKTTDVVTRGSLLVVAVWQKGLKSRACICTIRLMDDWFGEFISFRHSGQMVAGLDIFPFLFGDQWLVLKCRRQTLTTPPISPLLNRCSHCGWCTGNSLESLWVLMDALFCDRSCR
jgi:hypothetical protein